MRQQWGEGRSGPPSSQPGPTPSPRVGPKPGPPVPLLPPPTPLWWPGFSPLLGPVLTHIWARPASPLPPAAGGGGRSSTLGSIPTCSPTPLTLVRQLASCEIIAMMYHCAQQKVAEVCTQPM